MIQTAKTENWGNAVNIELGIVGILLLLIFLLWNYQRRLVKRYQQLPQQQQTPAGHETGSRSRESYNRNEYKASGYRQASTGNPFRKPAAAL